MDTNPEALLQSPVIVRPQDQELVAKLERKYQEYLGRMGDEFTHPEQAVVLGLAIGNYGPLDAYIKSRILRQVLDDGEVITWDWTKSFLEEDPIVTSLGYDSMAYAADKTAEACGIVNAYCNNDLSQVEGGTGLS